MKLNQKSTDRTRYLDALRILAAIAVVIIHTAAQNWHVDSVQSVQWQAFNFYDSMSRWSVPAFVMISEHCFWGMREAII